MSTPWNTLTKQRKVSEKGRKRVLVLQAAFSLVMAVAFSWLGMTSLLNRKDIWSGVFGLSLGVALFSSFSFRIRLLKSIQ